MADNRITRMRLKDHWHYNRLWYLAIAVAGFFFASVLFDLTEYRPPAEHQLTVVLGTHVSDVGALESDLNALVPQLCPEQERVTVLYCDLTTGMYTAPVQLATYISTKQGDLFIMPREQMTEMCGEGFENALMPLTESLSGSAIEIGETGGENTACVLPASIMPFFEKYHLDAENTMLAVPAYSINSGTAFELLTWLTQGNKL